MAPYLDLQSFIFRSRVLKLYRQALKIARRAPPHSKEFDELTIPAEELRQVIRQEIEKNRSCDDKQQIHFLPNEGMQRLKGLDEMLDMMGHS